MPKTKVRTRLAEECSKLDRKEEQRLADEDFAATRESWPEYSLS